MRRDDFEWSDEEVARLKGRRADGLSYGAIAREMGLTRNAVIGKAMRLGMRSAERPRGVAGGEAVKRVKAERQMKAKIIPDIPTEPTQPVDLPPDVVAARLRLLRARAGSPAAGRSRTGPGCFAAQHGATTARTAAATTPWGIERSTPGRTTIPMAWRAA